MKKYIFSRYQNPRKVSAFLICTGRDFLIDLLYITQICLETGWDKNVIINRDGNGYITEMEMVSFLRVTI